MSSAVNDNNKSAIESETEFQATLAILQINRTTDLINSLIAVQFFKQEHPNHRIILITRKEFSTPLNFLIKKYFDGVYEINSESLDRKFEEDQSDETLESIQQFLSSISHEKIDVLINLSFSKASSHLAGFIKASHKIGDYIDAQNRSAVNDKWSSMVTATVKQGPLNPYALVDLYKNIIGLKDTYLPKTREATKKIIVVHPFSSQTEKSWKADKWVEVIYKTLKDNPDYSIQLIGHKSNFLRSQLIVENPLLKQFSKRVFNLTSKAEYAQILDLLDEAQLFIGHESAISHLTSFAGLPTLILATAESRIHELTPYHHNSYVLVPRGEDNHEIPYQLATNLINSLIKEESVEVESFKSNNSSFHLSSVNFYKSNIVNGRQRLVNYTQDHQDTTEVFRNIYKVVWSFIINNVDEEIPFPALNPQSHEELLAAMVGLQHLFELSEFGKKYSRYILEDISSQTPNIETIKENSKKIDEIDELQKLVKKTSQYLSPLIDYHHIRKGNLAGENIVQLTENSYYAFEEVAHMASLLYELIENSVAHYQQINLKNKNIDFASR